MIPSFAVIVPTYNAGSQFAEWIRRYRQQSVSAHSVLIIDSDSQDDTRILAENAGFTVHHINKKDFNHGGTRNLAVNLLGSHIEFVVFLTQDALFADSYALENIIRPFQDESVAAVCGRQIPHSDADPLASFARLFNYPDESCIKSRADIFTLGIKAAFMSNSFAAYRLSAFNELGGFPENTILAEDMYLAAKMILSGQRIAYCAQAVVCHSHNYTLAEEFRRYFDIGVFHQQSAWIQTQFGSVGGEGKRFVYAQTRYIFCKAPWQLPRSFLSVLYKWLGYRFGKQWQKIPAYLRPYLSMHRHFWQKDKNSL